MVTIGHVSQSGTARMRKKKGQLGYIRRRQSPKMTLKDNLATRSFMDLRLNEGYLEKKMDTEICICATLNQTMPVQEENMFR
jgi:hypothetical protein